MTTQKVFSSRANGVDAGTYIGEAGRLFYAQTTSTGLAPSLRYSDGVTPGGLSLTGEGEGVTSITAGISVNQSTGAVTVTATGELVAVTDRLTSSTSFLVVTSDNTVTFPTLTTMSDSTASVVFNLADATIAGIVTYSTTSTDFIPAGTYGNPSIINAPYTVTEFSVTPPIALQDILYQVQLALWALGVFLPWSLQTLI